MNRSLIAGLVALGSALMLNAEPLEVGAEAPQVAGVDQNGTEVQLGDLYSNGYLLVYFYPRADTRGCTAQACSLRDAYEKLTDQGVKVVGVSTDTIEAQKAFAEKYSLPFTLLADPEHKVVDAFGVPLRGTAASRQAFLINDGKIVWRDLTASTEEQAQDVLAALEAIATSSDQ